MGLLIAGACLFHRCSVCNVLGLIEADCGRSQKHSRDHLLYTRKTSAQLLMRSTKYTGNDIILT